MFKKLRCYFSGHTLVPFYEKNTHIVSYWFCKKCGKRKED